MLIQVPPGCEVNITMYKNKDALIIHSFDTPTTSKPVNYKVGISQ